MKILQVTESYSPLHGGSAEVPYQLSRKLAARGHRVTVYTSDYQLTRDYIDAAPGVTVQPFKTWSSAASFYITPALIKRARQETGEFDVIQLNNYRTFQNIVMHHYAEKNGVPYVIGAHGSLPRIMSRQGLKRAYDVLWGYRLLKDAARLIATQPVEAEQYKELGAAESRIVQIPNGLNIEDYEQLPERGGFRERYGINEERMVLFLGRVDRVKGIDILVKATGGLIGDGLSVRLVVIGPDSGYTPVLKEMIKGLGIEKNVLFTGFVSAEDKMAAYVDADVYVLPSVYESFGMTVLEAAACGTPVILTENCQISGLVKDIFGLVVKHDEGELQAALVKMLTDDGLRKRLGETGWKLVREKYSWSRIIERLENVYEEVLEGRHG